MNFSPLLILLTLVLIGCNGSNSTSSVSSSSASSESSSAMEASSESSSSLQNVSSAMSSSSVADASSSSSAITANCSGGSDLENLVCASNAFLETLSDTERSNAVLEWSDTTAKTVWSNLPGVNRNGLKFGNLDSEALTAAMLVAKKALSDEGYADFTGVLAADDYLGSLRGGNTYSADNYYIAFFGEPSVDGDWMLQIGGHHLAYNIAFVSGEGYPVPNHIGVEPKSSFEINSATYAPLADEGDAMVAMFDALSSSQLSEAFLNGETYSDVLIGPDNGSGTLPSDYPAGNRGLAVSSLSTAQQAVVIAAIKSWVSSFSGDVADALIADYTTEAAFDDTYIAWAGSESAGVDVDHSGTYMRIDGPRLWIEIACQSGVVISNQTHYHTMYRDKLMDYANSL